MNRRTGLTILILFMAGAVILRIVAVLLANYPGIWDDAYMFVRYADNLLHEGKLSWNPGGPPTYGLTSLLYLSVVVPLRAMLPQNMTLAILLSSLLAGLAFIALLSLLLLRYVDASKTTRAVLLLAILWAIAITFDHQAERIADGTWTYYILNNHLAKHFLSGMGTMFALSYLTLYIIAAKQHERSQTRMSAVILGILGGLAFFTRPDLLLYSLVVPLCLMLISANQERRRHGLLVLIITIIIVGLSITSATLYFGSPFPLGFFAKGQSIYGDGFNQAYKGTALLQFVAFVVSYWYLFILIGAAVVMAFARRQRPTQSVEIGLLAGTILFSLYYLFFVLQIMGFSQRFYYPTLPALIFLAAQAIAYLISELPQDARDSFHAFTAALPRFYSVLAILFLVGSLFPLAPVIRDVALRLSNGEPRFLNMTVNDTYQAYFRLKWFALDELAEFPDDLVLATTEVGHTAALNPSKQIIDMAGLNDPRFALTEFSAETLFGQNAPDFIYMPHPDYETMIEEIENNPIFQSQYEYFPPESLDYTYQLGFALRMDSPYYPRLRTLVDQAVQENDKVNN